MLRKFKERSRGSILLLVLFLLIILAMMGSAFSILLPVEMQTARRDRANVQTAYAADAAVLWVMDQLDNDNALRAANGWDSLEGQSQVLDREWEWRVASVDRLAGNEAYRIVTEGIRIRGNQRDVLRRATAVVDNAWIGDEAAVINLATPGSSSPMGSNPNLFWPGNVPIYGDVIVLGTWSVDEALIDFNNGPTFGNITQTENTGSGLRGENYKGTNLSSPQYDQVYTNGVNSVQTGDVGDVGDLYMTNVDARHNMQRYLFSTEDTTTIETMHNAVTNNLGIHIPLDQNGVPNGGVVVNDGGGNNDNWDILFSVDADGNSVMNYTGDAINSISTISASDTSPSQVSTDTTTNEFKIIHVTEGSQYGAPGEQRLVIETKGGDVIYNEIADFSNGTVVYNLGSMSVRGTFTGEKTVASSLSVDITGELLKDGIPRGMSTAEALADNSISDTDKARINKSLLGLVSNIDANNASKGMRFDINSLPIDPNTGMPDPNIYIHASLMGSSKVNSMAKMFGNNIAHNLPANADVHLFGQLATPQQNGGQYKKELEFIAANVAAVYSDRVPIGFPTKIEGFTPRLRAYVDQQLYDTE